MAAMFQAQSANWEETQEKMSQSVNCSFLVIPPPSLSGFFLFVHVVVRCLMIMSPFALPILGVQIHLLSATHIFNASRGPPRSGSKPVPSTYQPPDSPLPASYVCYRCGQKGEVDDWLLARKKLINCLSRPLDKGLPYQQRP